MKLHDQKLFLIILCILLFQPFLIGNTSAKTIDDQVDIKQVFPDQSGNTEFSNYTETSGNQQHRPSDPVTIDVNIGDPEGVKNASLHWKYTSIADDTLYNASMTKSSTPFLTITSFESTNQSGTQEHIYGNYTYTDSVISGFDLTLLDPDNKNVIVYVKIETYNNGTSTWNTIYQEGTMDSTSALTSLDGSENFYYSDNSVSDGVRVHTVAYFDGGGQPNAVIPGIELQLFDETTPLFTADISPPGQTTFVDYYIDGYDSEENSFTSPTQTFLMDAVPTISINNLPTILGGTSDYVINATISDVDGYETIDQNEVYFYYKLQSQNNWRQTSFTFIENTTLEDAIFQTTVNFADLNPVETTLDIMVNATDTVDSATGYTGSFTTTTTLDNLHPEVPLGGITFTADPSYQNNTLPTSNVTLTVTFEDISGIKSANIFYKYPQAAEYFSKIMVNQTELLETETSEVFDVIVPPALETGYVDYYFEVEDFLGNIGTSQVNRYYSDGLAPQITDLIIVPRYVAHDSDANILFNTTDLSGVSLTSLYYREQTTTQWNEVTIGSVPYAVDSSESFTVNGLPGNIKNAETTYFNLLVERTIPVQEAILTISVNHDKTSDLRMYLSLNDRTKYLVFDRSQSSSITLNLFDFGFTKDDFDLANFTLEIIDSNELHSGTLTDFTIELIDYNYPLGYAYISTVAALNNDTMVEVYLSLTDNLGNARNTTIYTYYSDGKAPTLDILTNYTDTMDMDGSNVLDLEAKIVDRGGLEFVEVIYSYQFSAQWQVIDMIQLDNTTYTVGIPLDGLEGNISFYVRVFDFIGFKNESNIINVEYTNANGPVITLLNIPTEKFDADQSDHFPLEATIVDDEEVVDTLLRYRFSEDDDWEEVEFNYNSETGVYSYDIPYGPDEGTLYIQVSATDNNDIENIIEVSFEFENADGSGLFGSILTVMGIILVIGAIGGAAYYFLSKQGIVGKTPR